jgi:hypothetical protein
VKKLFLILVSFVFLSGCAQSVALLGPAFTIIKTGSIQQAFVGGSIDRGIKNETGKNVSEHVMQFLDKNTKDRECKNTNGETLQEVFFNTNEDTDCKKIQ